jgi:hypothetical protein
MARRLRTFVHVDGRAYGPGDEVPEGVARRIGAHAWEGDDEDETAPAVGFRDPAGGRGAPDTAPPRSGRGSGIEAWRAYAEANGVGTDDEMSRDDIIAAAESAGVIEREE